MESNYKFSGIVPFCYDGQKVCLLLRPAVPPPPPGAPPPQQAPPPAFKEFGGPKEEGGSDPAATAAKHFLAAVTGGAVPPSPDSVKTITEYMEEHKDKDSFLFYNTQQDYAVYFIQMVREIPVAIPCNWVPCDLIHQYYEQPGFFNPRLIFDDVPGFKDWLSKTESRLKATSGTPWMPPVPIPQAPPESSSEGDAPAAPAAPAEEKPAEVADPE
jgi:hypothetical protein|mmetsp:Transcript_25143/g.43056  ORF Transcript_25143/g.43056 Transcript_25143/m.43056 type:complete len:214 (-) Transcript_25143:127-768(-)|eukprot:CAMPEP_0174280242 /NCGR_PEP_ID=MMETSP0809-20121228/510_1 /TAXON_ID=73025 ORGANISM="Eutreptiella gymnastica-like, Strain CCMP1594" /NCGR_SAMPLE_ID=MMETSP0809 /ASSEMBLY_ACC=CAM_ASM_000658 /LENGTH=213 /DNA_ID=CAMNT_0015373001 /DNA_START=28 /DNA_END=669 /DNA_ORIENTATION=-